MGIFPNFSFFVVESIPNLIKDKTALLVAKIKGSFDHIIKESKPNRVMKFCLKYSYFNVIDGEC